MIFNLQFFKYTANTISNTISIDSGVVLVVSTSPISMVLVVLAANTISNSISNTTTVESMVHR